MPDLAASLYNQATTRSDLGDRAGALAASNEAVTIFQQLAQTNPVAFLPNFTKALNKQLGLRTIDSNFAAAAAAWNGALADQQQAVMRGELRASLARAAALHDQGATAAEAILKAAEEVETDPGALPEHVVTRARKVVRDVARSLDPKPPGLPPWAAADLPDADIQFAQAWVNATSWAEPEAAIDSYPHALPGPTLHQSVRILASYFSQATRIRDLSAVLEQMAERGTEPVHAQLRDGNALQRLVEAWITTETWVESFSYLTDHETKLRQPEVFDLLSQSGHPAAAQHAAILYLLDARPGEAIQRIVTDPNLAADEALIAVDRANIQEVLQVMAACPQLIQTPGIGTFLLAVLTTLNGDADAADQAIAITAQTATPVQRRAYAIHLHRLAAALHTAIDHPDKVASTRAAVERLVNMLNPHRDDAGTNEPE